jgi:hypothetical protein
MVLGVKFLRSYLGMLLDGYIPVACRGIVRRLPRASSSSACYGSIPRCMRCDTKARGFTLTTLAYEQ